jgi:amidophosphoribosyltransferase
MCGITGILTPGRDAARLAYFGLYALQHRGQESAGIAAADGGTIRSHKDMGLIGAIFDESSLAELTGHIAIGHTRYSTTGSSIVVNAQPLLESTEIGDFAFAHNGNLTNTDELRESLSPSTTLQATSDSEVMAKVLVEASGSMLDRIKHVLEVARGAYSIVLCTKDELYAFRDPWGVRPLCLGSFEDGGYAVASESCALPTIGAQYVREIEPGEVVRITPEGIESTIVMREDAHPALCMFEYIYFARPDSVLDGRSIYMARYAMGRALAKEHPVDADVVMAIPDSAMPGGIGYAAESGLPFIEGLIKNRYIGRTFISPDQGLRARGVQLKFNPIVENLRGQRVVVVDDSIVRGTTTPRIVKLLRDAGASEVHLRITSPPIKHPCYLGVDMATYDELIAANYSVDEIRAKAGADSLGYLSLEGLVAATGRKREEMCLGCLTGEYPNVPAAHAAQSAKAMAG